MLSLKNMKWFLWTVQGLKKGLRRLSTFRPSTTLLWHQAFSGPGLLEQQHFSWGHEDTEQTDQVGQLCPGELTRISGGGGRQGGDGQTVLIVGDPMQDFLTSLSSSFSDRLRHPECVKEKYPCHGTTEEFWIWWVSGDIVLDTQRTIEDFCLSWSVRLFVPCCSVPFNQYMFGVHMHAELWED